MEEYIPLYRAIRCSRCGEVFDSEDAETNKVWDNEGNHILVYVCPECGKEN